MVTVFIYVQIVIIEGKKKKFNITGDSTLLNSSVLSYIPPLALVNHYLVQKYVMVVGFIVYVLYSGDSEDPLNIDVVSEILT